MRDYIRSVWRNATHPFRKLWRWAKSPDKFLRKARRFEALKEWAAEKRDQARKAGDNQKAEEWAARVRAYRNREEYFRDHAPPPAPAGNWLWIDGRQVPHWIGEIVLKVRDAGRWKGSVVSGYRTPEYSESLCYAMCGAPSCPGRCAGRNSNHCCPPTYTGVEPEGAVDVSDYWVFRAELQRLGHWDRLKNALTNDPVHFSRSGV